MSPLIAVLRARCQVLLQYRAAALAGIGTQVFWGVIKTGILTAFFAQASNTPITLTETLAFVWLGQAMFQLVPWGMDKELEVQVRSGQVMYELARPLDLYGFWFMRALAMRLMPLCTRALPVLLLAFSFFGLPLPASWSSGVLFCCSLVGAVVVSAAITTLSTISLFWTGLGDGIDRVLPATAFFLSGILVPLPLFPDSVQIFLDLQPFRTILDLPIRLYTGVIPPSEAPLALALQAGWALLLILLGRSCMERSMRRLTLRGG